MLFTNSKFSLLSYKFSSHNSFFYTNYHFSFASLLLSLSSFCADMAYRIPSVLLINILIEFTDHTKTDLYVLLFDDMILMTKHRRGIHGKFLKVSCFSDFFYNLKEDHHGN